MGSKRLRSQPVHVLPAIFLNIKMHSFSPPAGFNGGELVLLRERLVQLKTRPDKFEGRFTVYDSMI